jgi:RNA polymerase sigma-70 factor (ECF subfamily)
LGLTGRHGAQGRRFTVSLRKNSASSTEGSDGLALLLTRAGAGDRDAFERLYARTSAKLFGVIVRICANRELAKEALQESYVTIWQKAETYDPEIGSPIAWMARIARNRAIDLRRLRTERISELSDPIDDYDEASPADPASEAEQSEALRRLESCLDGLPADRKDMILLAYYSGWSREELADKFSRPVNTIKTVLRRSLALLRECLDGRD